MISEFIKLAEKKQEKSEEISESEIEAAFMKWVSTQKRLEAVKLVQLYQRGFLDRTILIEGGRVAFIEFKKLGKTLSQTQKKWPIIFKRLGIPFFVCDKIGQAERICEQLLELDTHK